MLSAESVAPYSDNHMKRINKLTRGADSQLVKTFTALYRTQRCSQDPTTCPYSGQD